MNLKGRIEKLEAIAPVEPPFILPVFVPAKDGKPYGTERGIQRIQCGDLTVHREEGETEDEFIHRARAEAERLPVTAGGMQGVYSRRFTADYGDPDE